MNLETGMYVRTKKGIAKVIGRVNDPTNYWFNFWITDGFLTINDDTEYIHELDIIGEPSFDIIDLIEVGDIIKYKELRTHITNNCNTEYYEDYVCDIHSKEELANIIKEIKGGHIKLLGIATKEQFKNNCYKIGDE